LEAAEKSVKTQLLLDAVAEAEGTQVGQEELTERILFQAQRYGMAPEQFIQQVQQAGQLGAVFADVRRGKALAEVVGKVTVTDSEGNKVDTDEMFGTAKESDAADEATAEEPAATDAE
jgi:trigger factor